nr:baculoviral IAP repeat-containing protein 7-B-like [Penaeus vannamei]
MRDEEYNYRFLRDIIIDRFKRTGMWTYDRIDTMILDVKESITPQIRDELENELEQMRNSITCKLCMVYKISVMFTPCAHMVTCHYCALNIERCPTFIDWPLEWLKPSELAAAGFYYMRTKDHCACIFCAQIIGMWEKNDNPRQEHERHSPHCPFIRGQNVGNIAINPKNNICYTQDTDICGTPRLMAGSYPECGLSDHVRCFHCGNGLHNWETSDIPWIEHARWYPDCYYVKITKGQEFIDKEMNWKRSLIGYATLLHV